MFAGILDIVLWIVGILVVIGAIVGVLAFLGLRKLWRFVSDSFEADGRDGPGEPPPRLRRSSSLPPPSDRPTG